MRPSLVLDLLEEVLTAVVLVAAWAPTDMELFPAMLAPAASVVVPWLVAVAARSTCPTFVPCPILAPCHLEIY